MKNLKYLFLIFLLNLVFYFPIFLDKTPLPADNLLAYYPWKFYAEEYKPKGPAYFDVMNIMYPWKKLAVQSIKAGHFPLWNSNFGLGYPYFAAMQGGILYPTTLLFLILPFGTAWTIHIFIQTLMAGIFMFLLLKFWKFSSLASLFGALSFSFCGHFMVWLEYGTLVNAACWLPLVILLIELLFKQKKVWISIFSALVLAISFMAGFPQTTFYVLAFSGVYFIYKFKGIKGIKGIKGKRGMIRLGILGLLGFLGLIAVQFLPFLEYLNLSTRKLADPKTYFSWALLPTHLINFILPDFFGNPHKNLFWGRGNYQEFTVYLGIIPFIFAVLAILKRRSPQFWVCCLGGILILLVYNPILCFFYKLNLPIISKMSPSRLIVLLSFVLSILASYGFEQFIREKRILIKNIILIYFGFLGLTIFNLFFFGLEWAQERFHYDFKAIYNQTISSFYFPVMLMGGFLAVLLFGEIKKASKKIMSEIFILMTIFDLFWFGWGYNPFIDLRDVFLPTKTIKFLQTETQDFRFFTTGMVFPANFSSIFGLNGLNSYDTLVPLNYSNFLNQYFKMDQKILDIANVKYFLAGERLNLPDHKLVFESEGVSIFQRMSSLPRFFIISEKEKTTIDLKTEYRAAEDYILKFNSPQKGFLVLSQLYFPGWEAKVNGVKTKISAFENVFGKIEVDEGEYLVEVAYRPRSFRIGILVSAGTLGLIIIIMIIKIIIKK